MHWQFGLNRSGHMKVKRTGKIIYTLINPVFILNSAVKHQSNRGNFSQTFFLKVRTLTHYLCMNKNH